MATPLSAVLLDVGGTLWPSAPRDPAAARRLSIARIRAALTALTAKKAAGLVERLVERADGPLDGSMVQYSDIAIRATLPEFGVAVEPTIVAAVRAALCLPAIETIDPFPGAGELLRAIRSLGLRCVIVSNVTWRTAQDYRRDFEDLGLSEGIDAIVTSLDVGYYKPHRAMFDAALAAAGCPAEQCVMIGNSEEGDILPAIALGLRAIRVAIEQPLPAATVAHACVGSLDDAARVLRAWVEAGPHPARGRTPCAPTSRPSLEGRRQRAEGRSGVVGGFILLPSDFCLPGRGLGEGAVSWTAGSSSTSRIATT